MNKTISAALAAATALGCVLTSAPAAAQYYDGYDYDGYRYDAQWRDSDRDGRPDRREWNRDRDRDGRPDQWDRTDRRSDRYRWRHWGGRHGYSGYHGRWRTGYRYPYYRDERYMISDYGAYGLPAPWRGYRYYRDDNGDIVMAAIASGVIGLILGSSLGDRY